MKGVPMMQRMPASPLLSPSGKLNSSGMTDTNALKLAGVRRGKWEGRDGDRSDALALSSKRDRALPRCCRRVAAGGYLLLLLLTPPKKEKEGRKKKKSAKKEKKCNQTST